MRVCALLRDSLPSVCIVSLLDCSASGKLALWECFNAERTPTLGAYLQELVLVRAKRGNAPEESRDGSR